MLIYYNISFASASRNNARNGFRPAIARRWRTCEQTQLMSAPWTLRSARSLCLVEIEKNWTSTKWAICCRHRPPRTHTCRALDNSHLSHWKTVWRGWERGLPIFHEKTEIDETNGPNEMYMLGIRRQVKSNGPKCREYSPQPQVSSWSIQWSERFLNCGRPRVWTKTPSPSATTELTR